MDGKPEGELARTAHRTIAKVTDDIERRFQFHTPIAALFELVNEIYRVKAEPGQEAAVRFATETAVSLIQPYAPHVAEELWQRLGHRQLWREPWPEADAGILEQATFELVVQVNGKVRDRVTVEVGLSDDALVEHAKALPRVLSQVDGQEIRTGDRRSGEAREPGGEPTRRARRGRRGRPGRLIGPARRDTPALLAGFVPGFAVRCAAYTIE